MSELDQQRSTWLENLHPGKHPFRTLEGRGIGTALPQLIPFGHQTLCGDDVSQHACAYGRLWVQQSTSVNSSGWLISDLAACSYSATYFSIIPSDEKRLSASRLHKALSISPAAEMASAISARWGRQRCPFFELVEIDTEARRVRSRNVGVHAVKRVAVAMARRARCTSQGVAAGRRREGTTPVAGEV